MSAAGDPSPNRDIDAYHAFAAKYNDAELAFMMLSVALTDPAAAESAELALAEYRHAYPGLAATVFRRGGL